jgi:hypothetical protein
VRRGNLFDWECGCSAGLKETKTELVLFNLGDHVAARGWRTNGILQLQLLLMCEEVASLAGKKILRAHLSCNSGILGSPREKGPSGRL